MKQIIKRKIEKIKKNKNILKKIQKTEKSFKTF